MTIRKSIERKQAALAAEAARLQAEVERLNRLLPLLGKSAAVVGNSCEDEMDIVEVGDEVYSKYGEEGVITGFKNIEADHWDDVIVCFKDPATGRGIRHRAGRMNRTGGIYPHD